MNDDIILTLLVRQNITHFFLGGVIGLFSPMIVTML